MWFVYILKSQKTKKHYIGFTDNLERRLGEHNSGKTVSLKFHIPLELIYTERFDSREEACEREKKIKSYKGGNAFKQLLQHQR